MDDEFSPQVGNIRSKDYRRVSYGVFLRRLRDADPDREWLRDLSAWLEVLPEGSVFTGLTAARLAGWALPTPFDWIPIFATAPAGSTCPRRSGLNVTRLARVRTRPPQQLKGYPVDHPGEVLLRCARDLGLLDLVPLVESALADGVTPTHIRQVCARPRPGVRNLREALDLAHTRSESPMETVTRLFAWCMEIDVEVQPEFRDDQGRLLARGDLQIRGTRHLVEYDGAHHRTSRGQRDDVRRGRVLAELGLHRLAYTASELLKHPAAVMTQLDEILGRPTDLDRLRSWRAMVAMSGYSHEGQMRLRTRWSVPMSAFSAS